MTGKELLPHITANSRGERFSQNLMKWVRCNRDRDLFVAFEAKDGLTFNRAKTQAPSLYIGYLMEDGFLFGSRLSEILCFGSKTPTWAFPNRCFVKLPFWWDGYIALGKCFIDPEHTLYYDRERWLEAEDGKTRRCQWCGQYEQYKHIEMVPQESWRRQTMGDFYNAFGQ